MHGGNFASGVAQSLVDVNEVGAAYLLVHVNNLLADSVGPRSSPREIERAALAHREGC